MNSCLYFQILCECMLCAYVLCSKNKCDAEAGFSFVINCMFCFNLWIVHVGVQGDVSELHNICFLLWNLLIERGVAYLDILIISCWFGCSQDVSFALRLDNCFYVWGHWIVFSREIQF